MNKKKVIWPKRAQESLKYHHDYIKQESPSATQKVRTEIINSSKKLIHFQEKFQADEYYPNNQGKIRRYSSGVIV